MMFKHSLGATTQVKFSASSLFHRALLLASDESSVQFTFHFLKGIPYQNNNKVDDLNCLARANRLSSGGFSFTAPPLAIAAGDFSELLIYTCFLSSTPSVAVERACEVLHSEAHSACFCY